MADAVAALLPSATDCAIAVATAEAVAEPQPDEDAYTARERVNRRFGLGCRVWGFVITEPCQIQHCSGCISKIEKLMHAS